MTQSCNQSQQQKHKLQKQIHHNHLQQQQHTSQMNNNHVKKERQSPVGNGSFQISLSRSSSTSPTSFRENSDPSSPSETLTQMNNNLSTNFLSSIHQTATSSDHENIRVSPPQITSPTLGLQNDFSKRNYSNFMRSLAAKYNNRNPNESLKRNFLFEVDSNNGSLQKKISAAAQTTTSPLMSSAQLMKEVTIPSTSSIPLPESLISHNISPNESVITLSQQNKIAAAVVNAATTCSSNTSPYITPFLSSISEVFPPLIDMSSTQALITLARAAQENEINTMLNISSQNSTRSVDNKSPSSGPSLNIALQQAAQYISPTLISAAQLQRQQEQHPQVTTQSSPCLANTLNSTIYNTTFTKISSNQGYKINITPLDLTSQPPAVKRFKTESTSNQSNTDAPMPITIVRRASSSTITTSPSPPPIIEIPFNTSTNAVLSKATQSFIPVDSCTVKGDNTIAILPINVPNSTSAISNVTPTITNHQCQAHSEELNSWTVNDVCSFVSSIDICAEYAKSFRDQCIDGSGLPLLTEDHLVNSLGMKLGPALKLRSVLAKKLGGPCPCVSCVLQAQQMFILQTSGTSKSATKKDHEAVAKDNKSSCNSQLTENFFSDKNSINFYSHTSNTNSSACYANTRTLSKNSTVKICCHKIINNSILAKDDGNLSPLSIQLAEEDTETVIKKQNLNKRESPTQNMCSSPSNTEF